ncbi:HD-GYP domain-containing protein [Marinitoga hydrogenitolerans]|uniref:HD-GYP domain-containing protein n=1 Tax=Marinitoga hydrogenitolerans TaxID=287990 RepID=UPI003899224A
MREKNIPFLSRIIMLSDSFDAMTTKRSYKLALSIEEAIIEIKKNKGSQFDPILAEKFVSFIKTKFHIE